MCRVGRLGSLFNGRSLNRYLKYKTAKKDRSILNRFICIEIEKKLTNTTIAAPLRIKAQLSPQESFDVQKKRPKMST